MINYTTSGIFYHLVHELLADTELFSNLSICLRADQVTVIGSLPRRLNILLDGVGFHGVSRVSADGRNGPETVAGPVA